MKDRNIVYFKGRMADNLFIGIDAHEVCALMSVKVPSQVLGEAPEEECMIFLDGWGDNKPFMVVGSPEEVTKKLGWPYPPRVMLEADEPPPILKAPTIDITQ